MDLFDQITLYFKQLLTIITPYVVQFWDFFQDYAYLRAGLIASAAYFISKLIAHYIPLALDTIFQRLHFPVAKDLLALIKFPLFYFSFMTGLIIAVKVSDFNEPVAAVLVSILKSILIAVFAISVYRILVYVLGRVAENTSKGSIIQPKTLPLFNNSALVFVMIAAIHQIFAVWDVDMTALLTSAGIAGLAIGMASKDTLSDIIAGVLIITDNPYKLGDFIHLKEGNSGSVTHIGIRSTRIKTKDNVEVIVPNSKMGSSEVFNESSVSQENGIRIKLDIRTAYGADVLRIRELILAIADNDPEVMQDQKKAVILAEFDERYMLFRLLCWIDSPLKRASVMSRLRESIYNQFKEQEIDIALPAKQSIAISEQPEFFQKIAITEIPKLEQELAINKIPNLFGHGAARKIVTPPKSKPTLKPTLKTKSTTSGTQTKAKEN